MPGVDGLGAWAQHPIPRLNDTLMLVMNEADDALLRSEACREEPGYFSRNHDHGD